MDRIEVAKTKTGYELRKYINKEGDPIKRKVIISKDEQMIRRFLRDCTSEIKNADIGLNYMELYSKKYQISLRDNNHFFEEPLIRSLMDKARRVEEKAEISSFKNISNVLFSKRNIAFLTGTLFLVGVASLPKLTNEFIENNTSTIESEVDQSLLETTLASASLEMEEVIETEEVPEFIYVEQDIVVEHPSDFDLLKNSLPEFASVEASEELAIVKENYQSKAEKWGNIMGIDPEVLCCVMAQERVTHSSKIDKYGAYGIMQIQGSVWLGEEISYYNVQTDTWEKYKITENIVKDLDGNIKTGAAIFQNYLYKNNKNIFLAIQEYNFGGLKLSEAVRYYTSETGKTLEDVRNDPTNIEWIPYCKWVKNDRGTQYGDPNYIKNVFKRYDDDSLYFISKDQEKVTLDSTTKKETSVQIVEIKNPEYQSIVIKEEKIR